MQTKRPVTASPSLQTKQNKDPLRPEIEVLRKLHLKNTQSKRAETYYSLTGEYEPESARKGTKNPFLAPKKKKEMSSFSLIKHTLENSPPLPDLERNNAGHVEPICSEFSDNLQTAHCKEPESSTDDLNDDLIFDLEMEARPGLRTSMN